MLAWPLRLLYRLIMWLLAPREATMPDPGFARDLDTIDAELGSIAALNRDANCQLASVRRQICEMQAHELNLIAAVDARHRRADRLLDERNHATLADQLVRQ